MHNAEYVLGDDYKAMSEYSRKATSVFMKMQQDQTSKIYSWLDCGAIQDNTKVRASF